MLESLGQVLPAAAARYGDKPGLIVDDRVFSFRALDDLSNALAALKPGAAPDADAILALCRKELAAYKVPRTVQFVADLPKTSTGKVMRRSLKTLDT
jgi:acyl-coenzyme A synthetase/AMP-(fatty) acid ligase